MASFGAKYPYFNPVAEEPEGKLPVYKDQEPVRVGRLVKADLTVNLASGKLFADDGLAESVEEFSSGSIAMETDDMEDPVAGVVYGCTVEGKMVRYNVGDDPPAGGLAYFKKLMRRKKVLYKGYFYPLVKAALGNDTAQTKTDSITFGTNNTTFTVFACETGDWRFTEEFKTEPEAIDWIKKQLQGKKRAATPTATPAAGGGARAGGGMRHTDARRAADISYMAWIEALAQPGRCPIEKASRPQSPGEYTTEHYRFTYCDLDFNRHVNSSRYIELLLNQWPLEFHDANRLTRFEIAYLHEAYSGEEVEVRLSTAGSETRAELTSGSTALCRARLCFSPREPEEQAGCSH